MPQNRNKSFKNKPTAFPSTTPTGNLYVMAFDLVSELKFFLRKRNVIYWLAILLEETIAHQVSVSLPHWLKFNFTQDESTLSLTDHTSVYHCCSYQHI